MTLQVERPLPQILNDVRVLVPREHFNVVYRDDPGALWRGAKITPGLVNVNEGQALLRVSDAHQNLRPGPRRLLHWEPRWDPRWQP